MSAHPAAPLPLAAGDLERLSALACDAAVPAALATRARIVLLASAGTPNQTIAREVGVTRQTVLAWRSRYVDGGLDALHDRPRPGPARRLDERVIVHAGLEPPPRGLAATHWSTRLLGQQLGVSHHTVARAWRTYGVRPFGAQTFRFDTDPVLIANIVDVVGLALAPDARILVLRVHHVGRTGRRHMSRDTGGAIGLGPVGMYAALRAVLDDPVAHAARPEADLGRFLQVAERAHLSAEHRRPELALLVDQETTLHRPEVRPWVQAHRRVGMHTAGGVEAWLDLVEVCLTLAEQRLAPRNGTGCVPELDELIRTAAGADVLPRPFMWTSRIRPVRPRPVS